MFLRSQLVYRLPATSIRLYRNSVPSTSIATPFRRHSHIIAPSTPQLARHFGASLAWIRGSREETEEVKGARTKHTDNSNSSSSNKGGPEWVSRVTKLLAVAVISYLVVDTIGACWKAAAKAVASSAIPADAPQVDFATFAQKYLRAGKIRMIIYWIGTEKAVGTLHAGAIIDGKPAKSDHIVINYAHSPQQFTADVRLEEAEMGISSEHGVDIKLLDSQRALYAIVLGIVLGIAAFVVQHQPSKMKMLLEGAARRLGTLLEQAGGARAKHTVNDKKSGSKSK